MSDFLGYLAYTVVVLLFLGALTYYFLLFLLARSARASDAQLWAHCRGMGRLSDSDFSVAHRILREMNLLESYGASSSTRRIAWWARRNLYVSSALFMVVLFAVLYMSLSK